MAIHSTLLFVNADGEIEESAVTDEISYAKANVNEIQAQSGQSLLLKSEDGGIQATITNTEITLSEELAMGSNKISGLANGAALSQDAATVSQMEAAISAVDLSGKADLDLGNILPTTDVNFNAQQLTNIVAGALTGEAVEYDQMNSADNLRLKLDGTDTMSGALDMGSNLISNVTDPATAQDAATKNYVDSVAQGLSAKEACRASSTGSNVIIASELENTDILDGVTLATGDRVLLKDQTAPAENGIYIVSASGAASRSTDFDEISPIDEINGAYVPVSEGTSNSGKFFVQSANVVTVDTSPITFVFFNAIASGISEGPGIKETAGKIEVELAVTSGLEFDAVGDAGLLQFASQGNGIAGGSGSLLSVDPATEVAGSRASVYIGADGVGIDVDNVTLNHASSTLQIKDDGVSKVKLNADVAGAGLVQAAGGELDINVSGTDLEIVTDELRIAADGVNQTMIDWGTTGQQVYAAYIPVLDSAAYYANDQLEAVTIELKDQIGGLTSSTFNFTEDNVLADNDAIYAALDKLDQKHGDYASVAIGEGAELIGVEPITGIAGATVQSVLEELASDGASESFIADANGLTSGDLVHVSSNDLVGQIDTSATGTSELGFGLAKSNATSGNTTKVLHDGQIFAGILTGSYGEPGLIPFAGGDKVYFDSDGVGAARFVGREAAPSVSLSRVYQIGVAKNATDLIIDINFIKKNS